MDKIKQSYIDSELLDIDEDNPFVIYSAGYKTGADEWKAKYIKLYEWIVARNLIKEFEKDIT